MDGTPEDRPVLVAVADPARVEQLVRTASDLARLGSRRVQIVSVVSKPRSSPVTVYSDETIIKRFAQETQEVLDAALAVAPPDISIEREILVDRSVADGLLRAVTAADAAALVIGLQEGQSRTGATLGTNIDRLIRRAPCDLYVERVGYEAGEVDSILVPVAGGPHAKPATFAAKAIAVRNDATIYVMSVGDPESGDDTAGDDIETALGQIEDVPGPGVAVETLLKDGGNTADVIAETATDHDILIFGVTRQGTVRRKLVGSVPQAVLPRTDRTVLLARSGEVVEDTMFGRLRRLWKHT